MAVHLFRILKRYFPGVKIKLRKAGLPDDDEAFLKKTAMSSLYTSFAIVFILFLFMAKMKINLWLLLVLVPFLFAALFSYFLHYPDMLIIKQNKEISREIVYAGRFLVIELESGVSLYNAMVNLTKNYKALGRYFREIVHRIDLGTSMEESLIIAVETSPSPSLNKIYWQLLNSMKTGSDVTNALKSVMDQIVKEQIIMVREYGRKLNPLAMFYMMMAVILPSIGMTMVIVISTFVNIEISLTSLFVIVFFLGFMQFMFFNMIRTQRPAVGL